MYFVFGIISIIIFFLSMKADKKFMQSSDSSLYSFAKRWGTATNIFFVLAIVRLVIAVATITVLPWLLESVSVNTYEEIVQVFVYIFKKEIIIDIFAFIVGFIAFIKYKTTKKAYFKLTQNPAVSNGAANPTPYVNGRNKNI